MIERRIPKPVLTMFTFVAMNGLFTLLFLGLVLMLPAQGDKGEAFLRQVHQRHEQAPCKSYSFSQKNAHYRNDSVIKQSTWHEAIEFPDKFRIQFGEAQKGNAVLFRNDSAYTFREGKLIKARRDSNSLLLILGGMYYREFNEVLKRLKHSRFNCSLLSEQEWKGKAVCVLGAAAGDTKPNQIWFDKNDFRVLRILESRTPGEQMDMRFESHQVWCKGFVENKVSFYRNGKLEQVEEYYDLQVLDHFPD